MNGWKSIFVSVTDFIAPYVYMFCRLVFGTLYPAYASWKAIRTKDVREYVKWMMYWIVFALFTCFETFTDVFLSWVPLYYEVKVVFVLWLLSPLTQGSSFLFRKFVHPHIARRETDIDALIAQTRETSYTTLVKIGTQGIRYASDIVLKTAMMGQNKIADHMRKSYSMTDLAQQSQHAQRQYTGRDDTDNVMDSDDELDNRLREDNEELKRRQDSDDPDYTPPKVKGQPRKSLSLTNQSPLELSSVMEEDDDFEVIKQPPKITRHNTRSSAARTRANHYSSSDKNPAEPTKSTTSNSSKRKNRKKISEQNADKTSVKNGEKTKTQNGQKSKTKRSKENIDTEV